ncbi:plasmid partitioning protein [Frankia sp. Cr2]|uniref:plasmid partitioning protein n=1 Tax=Frankia sp. Cr2 TaxID=3073932 RepID=UPI002AD267E2|nr:plasmid partitioning protein [Frankia sp. Cr2]
MVSNPLKVGKDLWTKNRRRALIVVGVVVVVFAYAHGSPTVKTERAAIPAGYASAGRELAIHADPKPGQPVPLVLVLHDYGKDAASIEKAGNVSTLADGQKFALVYPEAVASTWQVNGPDAQYLRDVVRYVATERSKIDMSRIYIWGAGEGGRMALTVACSSLDSAQKPLFAVVGAVGAVGQAPPCPSQVHVTLLPQQWDEATTRALWKFSKVIKD